ncbi:glycoside hydrolase family 26 protein [Dyadobacter sp. CY345]|uniref:glycoside hydrolase family 26 protein n=1 Tax=Dyadobacter sp. CY345 TaxID=2909335 RepID=UPI001F3BF60B|nr:glycosyl hydrolase [Dyadobacter sp. CY345]MCF2443794.1 glycoside hydrolase family 26 protein [Dyadobacter sp. CY345]
MRKLFLLTVISFSLSHFSIAQIDAKATKETKALYKNLDKFSKTNILFGHQHATEYGHGWSGDADRSDVKSVTGSHPAVIGIDISGLSGRPVQEIEKNSESLRKNVVETYNRGGVTTISWHFSNPASGGGFYWKDSVSVRAIELIKPGGSHHEKYKEILKTVADFTKSAKGKNGEAVPMLFRPYHEFDGDWFWWGKGHCSREDFISVWQFTVSYMRDSLGVHNFIYVFSPDCKFNSEQEFLERYPGDQFVDMVGMDNYADFGRDGKYNLKAGVQKLKIISDYAKKANKLAAFTETGLETIPDKNWWTESLLKSLKAEKINLAYVLVWRNDTKSPTHYYAPFPGQISVPDFMNFYNDPYTLFEKDLKNIYR